MPRDSKIEYKHTKCIVYLKGLQDSLCVTTHTVRFAKFTPAYGILEKKFHKGLESFLITRAGLVWRGTVAQSEIFHTTGLYAIQKTHIKWLHVHNAGNINSICWCRAMRSVEKWHADTREAVFLCKPAGQCKMHYCNKWLQWCVQDLWPHAKHPHSHTAEPGGGGGFKIKQKAASDLNPLMKFSCDFLPPQVHVHQFMMYSWTNSGI